MLDELRLIPRSPAARSRGRRHGESAATDGEAFHPGLSTGFADRRDAPSTGGAGSVERLGGERSKEGVA